jgi:hypothetical protein
MPVIEAGVTVCGPAGMATGLVSPSKAYVYVTLAVTAGIDPAAATGDDGGGRMFHDSKPVAGEWRPDFDLSIIQAKPF